MGALCGAQRKGRERLTRVGQSKKDSLGPHIYIRVSTVALKFLSCLPARLRHPCVGAFVFVPVYVVPVVSGFATTHPRHPRRPGPAQRRGEAGQDGPSSTPPATWAGGDGPPGGDPAVGDNAGRPGRRILETLGVLGGPGRRILDTLVVLDGPMWLPRAFWACRTTNPRYSCRS